MGKFSLLLAILLTAFLHANSHATVMVKCFTGEFVRGTGKPVVESHTFSGMNGQATIKLFNGGPQGTAAKRVSSSTVRVNGAIVFGPSSFNQNVSFLETPITLKEGNNSLEVLLNGKPGGKIQIEIVQAKETDYSGTYCFILQETNSIMATGVVINQSNGTVTLTFGDLANLTVTGLLNGNTLTVTEQIPNEGELDMVVTFSNNGQILSGTFKIGAEQGTVAGSKGLCANYTYPEEDPVCILPVENLSLVTGGQQYNSVYNGVRHTGLDFKFGTTLSNIIAPCDGVIKGIKRSVISEGNIIFDVDIRYNRNWGTFIAFEPYSPDPVIADMQAKEIYVSVNQVVKQGDLLGRLVVPDPITEFPHIHWGVYRNDVERSDVCPKNYLKPEAQLQLYDLYSSFPGPSGGNLIPECLP